jgi:hypothetical protein
MVSNGFFETTIMSRQPTVREGGRFWTLCQSRQLVLVPTREINGTMVFLKQQRHEQGSREGGRFRTLCQSRRTVLVPTWEINGANQSYHISARFLKD